MFNRILKQLIWICASFLIGLLLYSQVDVIHRGGPVMILIVICSIFSMAITAERLYYFIFILEGTSFVKQLRRHMSSKDWIAAQRLCEHTNSPVAGVVAAGLTGRNGSRAQVEQLMNEAAFDEHANVNGHHGWLSTIAQVSTLLGLLGTVIGMVIAFQVIEGKVTATNPVNPADLAGGIWQALTTTVAGLSVAIPTILSHNYLAGKIEDVQFEMNSASELVLNSIDSK